MKILGHCAYIGRTGYAIHSRNFFRALSKEADLKIRNFSIDSNWQGVDSKDVHGNSVDETDKKILALQTCSTGQGYVDLPIYDGVENFNHDYDIVLIDCHHQYYNDNYSGKKIFYNVWEKIRYSDEFFEKLKTADQIWVPTHWQNNCLLKQGISREKVKIVPEGINPEELFPENLQNNDKFTFLILGKWEKRKSTKELVKAFAELFGDNDKVELLLSCSNNFPDDGHKSTEERLKEINVNCKNIKIIDFQERHEVIKMVKSSHVFLSCARSEGWNLPLIESLACGIPSIYSDCSGQLEFAKGLGIPVKIHGEVMDGNDPMFGYYDPDYNDLKKKMLEVYNSYEFYKQKALRDSDFIRENFTWEKAAKIAVQHLSDKFQKKTLNITNESASLGDFIAWTPVVARYAKEKDIQINYFTPYKQLLQKTYPELNFFDYNENKVHDKKIDFRIGCFGDGAWKGKNLQEIACMILGLNYREEPCRIKNFNEQKRIHDKKYVCIGTQSTSQCKYWNNPSGWNDTVLHLKSLGYDVICIDKQNEYGIPNSLNRIPNNCIDDTGEKPLDDRISTIMGCEFFIGLGSGLSWLAWACGKPVVMISGFSDPASEFYTPYRVHNKNVCNSCWNDKDCNFDRADWMWCPRNKNFECSKEISFDMVKEKIDLCINDINNTKNIKLIIHHFNEDLNWINYLDHSYDYVVYSRNLPDSDKVININHDKGVESCGYLQFIIDNYDNLPENMIFLHAHRESWHQDGYVDVLIKKLDWNKYYFNINNFDILPLVKGDQEVVQNQFYHRTWSQCEYRKSYKLWVEDVWSDLFAGQIEMPERIEGKCGAQFLVKKEIVRKYSKEFYQRLLNWLLTTDIDDRLKIRKNAQNLSSQVSGRVLEYVWNILFDKKTTLINFVSDALGDNIAHSAYADLYQQKFGGDVLVASKWSKIFYSENPNVKFIDKNENLLVDKKINIHYRHGDCPIQKSICEDLNIDYKEIFPFIKTTNDHNLQKRKKYVCISAQSTSQMKYWNNPVGWRKTIRYLKSLGYDVICIDKYKYFGSNEKMNEIPADAIDETGDYPLEYRIEQIKNCEFFIGLSSGLSWLAWALRKKVVLITGISLEGKEFYTPYRVSNTNVCHGCCCKQGFQLSDKHWTFCPENKNFECTTEISFDMAKQKIDQCINDLKIYS